MSTYLLRSQSYGSSWYTWRPSWSCHPIYKLVLQASSPYTALFNASSRDVLTMTHARHGQKLDTAVRGRKAMISLLQLQCVVSKLLFLEYIFLVRFGIRRIFDFRGALAHCHRYPQHLPSRMFVRTWWCCHVLASNGSPLHCQILGMLGAKHRFWIWHAL